jgi:hypothetical protein
MGSNVVGTRNLNAGGGTIHWGAIFGGTFVFIAVMSTFGLLLASAIFASAGWTSFGFMIWNAVVAIISLYIAGWATAHLAAVTDRSIGMWHGLVTFGMCFISTILVGRMLLLTAAPYSAQAATNHAVAGNLMAVAVGGGWTLWIAMFLGFIAAAWGGTQAAEGNVAMLTRTPVEQPDIHRVA